MRVLVGNSPWRAAWIGLAGVCASAWAAEPGAIDGVDAVAAAPRVEPAAPRPLQSWAELAARELRPPPRSSGPAVSLIELPPDGAPGAAGQRRHHALSIRSEAPQRMLRALGVEASDCATRLRAPSKLRQDPGGGVTLSVTAQVGLACRF